MTLLFSLITFSLEAQTGSIRGYITDPEGKALEGAGISIPQLQKGVFSDSTGRYELNGLPNGTWLLKAGYMGFLHYEHHVTISEDYKNQDIVLSPEKGVLQEVVVSGTMKEVSKLDSPVPVEVYSARFFKANPTPSIFDALQNINGVRPQLNCNICNTGDIHINGLEGPYTMILVDGMPIVSGLSTVYGLSGIPQSLIDRIEVVKGPASTLYGSEAVGGLINIITKSPLNAPLLSADVFATSWAEVNTDLSAKFKAGSRAQALFGLNYFNYQNPIDNNKDNFTDVTLQNRVSLFNKWSIDRKDNRLFTVAGRYVYEDRWGGEMNWSKKYRGSDQVYAESIYTSRWELFGNYQLPIKEHIMFQFSVNGHEQNSVYGDMPYLASQYIAFGQLTWNKVLGKHDLLSGLTYRYTYYDDNTPATAAADNLNLNQPAHTRLPGLFLQDELSLHAQHKLLVGLRYDYNSLHGSILTPRLNYKWSSANRHNILRLGLGNGYRVANVFTEDHAALTGARQVVFINALKPERSWNANINFVKKIFIGDAFVSLDATAFYTYFTNKIIPDYDTDPNKILYNHLEGHARSRGLSANLDISIPMWLKIRAGATAMDVQNTIDGNTMRQLFAERFTGTWSINYTFRNSGLSIDYTGNIYGPMRLPLLSDQDPRREYSPWWSIQNIQLTQQLGKSIEIYGGVKNLLNWTPNKGNPFIIARSFDPFDKNVQFDARGQAMATADNPYGLTFDPSYVYGPNQGIRFFLGLRYTLARAL